MTSHCFVLDTNNKLLSPTKEVKAWYMIRKNKAILVSKYPLVIRLKKIIPDDKICKDEVRCGIDDGVLHVGIALVQKCQTKNKVLFKGVIEQRKDVKKLMDMRKNYRKHRRQHKRYRPERYNNRSAQKRKGRIPPSILQKKQAIIRVITQLNKWIHITNYWLEDVKIDTRALSEGYKPFNWQYQKSNRLDENIRKAVLIRDGYQCMECGKRNTILEVHHIIPKRLGGTNIVNNMITLCHNCHNKTKGKEEQFISKYSSITKYINNNLDYASHVMIGKTWLREQLSRFGDLYLTTGGDTANKRIDWNIEKSHSNDAICITNLQPDAIDNKEWIIKPIRRQSKAKTNEVMGFKHKDLVEYTYLNGETYRGYVSALFLDIKALSFISPTKICYKVRTKKCKLLWRFSKYIGLTTKEYKWKQLNC